MIVLILIVLMFDILIEYRFEFIFIGICNIGYLFIWLVS